jgi:hypothetical protein
VTTATLDSMGSLFVAEFGERTDVNCRQTPVRCPEREEIPHGSRDLRRSNPVPMQRN